MVKTLPMAIKAWTDKMKLAGPRWKKGVAGKAPVWKSSIAKFLGVPEGSVDPTRVEAYTTGTERVSAKDFATAVEDKGPKYGAKLKEALTK